MNTSSSQFSQGSNSTAKQIKQDNPLTPEREMVRALRRPWYERAGRGAQVVWHESTKNKKVAIGLIIVLFFILVAAFGPLFVHTDPNLLSMDAQAAPSAAHPLGTTALGQDIFKQLVVGTRSSIFWGFLTGIAVTIISILVGLVGGYFGGAVDEFLSLLTNVFLVLPALPLAIVLASYFPRGPQTVAAVIIVTSWSWGARVLRAQTLSMRSREFVSSAKSNGETIWRIIFFEIFPNEISIVAANFVSTTLYVILASASLEFLGLGDPNGISWGAMFYWAQKDNALISGLWWWFVPPGICIAVLGAGLSLINFGIDEIADPRLRQEKIPKLVREKKVIA
ncbi:ABC transporter permease [Dictyobacter arantiisoli]|uniref:Peptide ABC transporter permease n=1 Tax=Dictyobacter arantiisoli TaxID=2014874 RepID=A0A5A5T556_9CHLR|nr:ABC transporter permease [Dictyobacter arantiisoli]GCF06480.1 peptide ABC transporter permease [Dictyobacter arantiisoli]